MRVKSVRMYLPPMDGGLTASEVEERRVRFGRNVLPHDRWAHLRPVISVVKEPMFLLLLATAGVYLALGEMQEAWAMVGALVVVAGIDALRDGAPVRLVALP